ncbi:cytochrome-c peroxidase [Vibrio tubiashii]|uniref:Cytochrome B6 n=1 Tax=Vibrio tubiashii ATCC 19109 TaxID=1051646 RepID=F9T8W8_9VIBR|nr:cytochrome c peroxidase [Vibrio tubiashii]AIW14269.1 cytochrome B6 [Vibrio tubiashii ATCC 19109]EGU52058.1 cytochrome c551 peroxidase [Vibrio tubiashii ATCC 19109]EIF03828.1 cytochrome c551 peroxidase [Vibrio tubiashii NCIMB 1337 = ATCC 19106]
MTKNQRSVAIILAIALVGIAPLFWLILYSGENAHSHDDEHQHHTLSANIRKDQSPSSNLVSPIPSDHQVDKAQAKIGWLLFKDPRLSSNGQISCESCHDLSSNGAEPTAVSTGVEGRGDRNSLTVFNAALNYRFFWDGRANSLNAQIDGPIHSNVEMNSNWKDISEYVATSPQYSQLFDEQQVEVNEATIKSMLVEFMNALVTPDSPFDKYLSGDKSALTTQQIEGWKLFQQHGCIRCHRGTNIGGGMVMKFGLYGQEYNGQERSADTGRHMHTNKPEDMYIFRVASLRNVATTPPYFHDGQTHNLEDAIEIMARSQLGLSLTAKEVDAISAFLNTLTAERPAILEEFENELY